MKNYFSSSAMFTKEEESHAWVHGQKKKNFFLLLHTQDGGSYIMPEKHNRTAESHAGVLGKKKKNFFSYFTYTEWGGVI